MGTRSLQDRILEKDFTCLVIRGDCRDMLHLLPSGCIDLTVMDPAYESLERHRAVGTTTRLKESDASSNPWFQTFPNKDYWALFKLLSGVHKDNTHCYVFCDSETEHVILSGRNALAQQCNQVFGHSPVLDTGWRAWSPLAWVKIKNGIPSEAELLEEHIRVGMGYHWRRCEERILFLEKGKRKLNNLGWKNVLPDSRAGKNDYPTQKPQGVLRRLIENSSDPGDVVLDVFAGSGSTGHAAIALERRVILIDINIDWMRERPIRFMEIVE
jgi:site-specific DNA-methyltransferase (adenine-specific)